MKEIQLTQGKVALIDDEDFELVSKYKWYYMQVGYAATDAMGERHVYMHRFLMDFPKGVEVDHADRNPLNNQRANLRKSTRSLNMANQSKRKHPSNTSKFKGVGWFARDSKWKGSITLNYINKNLGYFFSEKDAALAYDRAAEKYFGKFAVLNFPDEKTIPVKDKMVLRKDNSSGYRGVLFTGIKYVAAVSGMGRHSGFSTPIEAALAYNYMAYHKFGQDAILNQLEIT